MTKSNLAYKIQTLLASQINERMKFSEIFWVMESKSITLTWHTSKPTTQQVYGIALYICHCELFFVLAKIMLLLRYLLLLLFLFNIQFGSATAFDYD